jgi:hypothetical protein
MVWAMAWMIFVSPMLLPLSQTLGPRVRFAAQA